MVDYYKGRTYYVTSVNDDVESFFIYLQNGEKVEEEVWSFYLPKLTEKELKQVEDKNHEHFMTYLTYHEGDDPDVKQEQMEKSESRLKFVCGLCVRTTEFLEIESS